MKQFLLAILKKITSFLPCLVVILVAAVIAVVNIDFGKYYSGWDNIHAEFDIARYARQVFFGAWIEHQGLGAPAAQGHLSEISRLPFLLLLLSVLPHNLVRWVYIFALYLVGGVSMYQYLLKQWLNQKNVVVKKWLASFGGVLYLLHILTLQQFYISFEMFMIQFAFFPLVLLTIHLLNKKISKKSLLVFSVVQLFIAPSGHTPTVFYLGVLLTLLYSFFLKIDKGLFKAIWFSFIVGLVTLVVNFYWIAPNVYYSIHNSHYVHESRENELFGPESVWSIRESSTWSNFFKGTHYLFSWKDYSFKDKKFELIFNDWENHLSQPVVSNILVAIGFSTILGFVITILSRKKGSKRFAFICWYIFCVCFMWIDLFPTAQFIEKLYGNPSFMEAFRNPVTKLSILYSIVSILFSVTVLELVTSFVLKMKFLKWFRVVLISIVFLTCFAGVVYSALPSFQGHFISEKLQVQYPSQYQDLFSYLKTRDDELRVLQLPQLSHAGWEYYDWGFLGEGNGYQGLGFYFFGFDQAFLHRDSDRWVESSDFFYHELKQALDTQNTSQLQEIFEKYHVDLIIIDETRIDPSVFHDYSVDFAIMGKTKLKKVWQKDFLTVYERESKNSDLELQLPAAVSKVSASTKRVRFDSVYSTSGEYVQDLQGSVDYSEEYPFVNLFAKQLSQTEFTDNSLTISSRISPLAKSVRIAQNTDQNFATPVAVTYEGKKVSVVFPKYTLKVGETSVSMLDVPATSFETDKVYSSVVVFIDEVGFVVEQGKMVTPVVYLSAEKNSLITYSEKPGQLQFSGLGFIEEKNLTLKKGAVLTIDWSNLKKPLEIAVNGADTISLKEEFPVFTVPVTKNPSVNCATPKVGSTETKLQENGSIVYTAHNFGVNCNGYDFQYLSPAYSYVMQVSGKTSQGRGIKFFLNYDDKTVLPEDFLMPTGSYKELLVLPSVSKDPRSLFTLNWEVRSFGKDASSELNSIKVMPLAIEIFSKIQVLPNKSDAEKSESKLVITNHRSVQHFLHTFEYHCFSTTCFIGLDQTFDDAWIGINVSSKKILPHVRYTTWASAWELNGEGTVLIVYLPEVVSLTAIVATAITLLWMTLTSLFKK